MNPRYFGLLPPTSSERSLLAIKSARAGSSIYIEQPSSQTRHLLGFKPKNVPTLIALENLKRLTLEIPDFSGFCHFSVLSLVLR
jgi:hypothetical protein